MSKIYLQNEFAYWVEKSKLPPTCVCPFPWNGLFLIMFAFKSSLLFEFVNKLAVPDPVKVLPTPGVIEAPTDPTKGLLC